jgi:RimJ/RimL family protein N-acetyltransferase
VTLRPLQVADAGRLFEILEADPGIRDKVSIARRLKTKADVEAEVARQKDIEAIRYALLRDGRCIGLVNFWRLGDYMAGWNDGSAPEPDTYGFGYFLDPAERGQGLAAEAVKAIMQVVRQTLQPKKFIAFCTDENAASRAVLENSGFRRTEDVIFFPNEGWHERKYVIDVE